MIAPLLKTKLHIPPLRPTLVTRARLLQQLDEGLRLGSQLTLVSAQAGFGKTTLLSEWASTLMTAHPQPVSVAWLSLDEGDAVPFRFWSYVIAALQTVHPEVGESAMAAIGSPQPPPLDVILVGLINDLAVIPDRFCLVLDDYHVIESQPIHDTLAYLLEHQPTQMHLVIATRADPPWPIARLRGRGQLTEVRVSDLRFTAKEAAIFLNQVTDLDLSVDHVAALEQRTEGWITGLHLAALAMQGTLSAGGQAELPRFIRAFTGSSRYVLDYLTEEVLQHQKEGVKTFLLETSILDRLTGPLCDAVTGQQDGTTMLVALEQANLFLIPLDEDRRWYRYHRLFSDLLRARLEDAQPDRVPELHRRASAWYEEEGALDEAVTHALAAGDLARVGGMVEDYGMPMLMQGELTTLQQWIEGLPETMILASAPICVSHAWVLLLTGHVQSVELRLQQAERLLQSAPVGRLPGDIAIIRAYVAAQLGDVARSINLAQRALDLLGEERLGERAIVYFVLGGAHLLRGDVPSASKAMLQASVTGQQGGNIHIAVPALNALAGLQTLQGHLHLAQATAQEAVQLATGPRGRPLPIAGGAVSALADLAYEWNDLETALVHAQHSVELSIQWGSADSQGDAYMTLARVLQARGDLDGASDALQKAVRMEQKLVQTPMFSTQLRAAQARLSLAQGSLEAARHWADQVPVDPPDLLHGDEMLALVRVRLIQGQLHEALQVLQPLLEIARAQEMTTMTIEALALQAMAHHAQGDAEQALSSLGAALSLAEPEGYMRRFLDLGEELTVLLHVARLWNIAPTYVSRLLAAFDGEGGNAAPDVDSAISILAAQPLVEPLSERELEVLRLIADGRSNREIAEELVIAVSTVKSHANHIFGKLGVKSRTQAVVEARELGLL